MTEKTSITEEEKNNIYLKMLNVLGETNLTTKEVYEEFILGFQSYALCHIYRTLAPNRKKINQKLFKDII